MCGNHRAIWELMVGQEVDYRQETNNLVDRYAVAVVKGCHDWSCASKDIKVVSRILEMR